MINLILNKLNLPNDIESPKYVEMCQGLSIHPPKENEWKGAVLFLFCGNKLILIKRSELVKTHKGQWAFFGGHRDFESESAKDVAFREFEEESNLLSNRVEFLGYLPPTSTRSAFSIIPVLGRGNFSKEELIQNLKSNGEWDLAVSIPFHLFFRLDSWVYGTLTNDEIKIPLNFLYFPLSHSQFEILSIRNEDLRNKDYLLWGATARMIWNFLRISFKYLP